MHGRIFEQHFGGGVRLIILVGFKLSSACICNRSINSWHATPYCTCSLNDINQHTCTVVHVECITSATPPPATQRWSKVWSLQLLLTPSPRQLTPDGWMGFFIFLTSLTTLACASSSMWGRWFQPAVPLRRRGGLFYPCCCLGLVMSRVGNTNCLFFMVCHRSRSVGQHCYWKNTTLLLPSRRLGPVNRLYIALETAKGHSAERDSASCNRKAMHTFASYRISFC